MALVTTTLSAALAQGDKEAVVVSATSIAAGRRVVIDQEVSEVSKEYVTASLTVPLLRGLDGTAQVAHPSSADFTHGDPTDFGTPGVSSVVNFPGAGRTRTVASYAAAGAIALPKAGTDAVAIILGSAALAMTLADPDEAITGSFLYVVNDTAAAHTLTNTTGFGGAGSSYDVLTFDGSGTNGVILMAVGAKWVLMGQTDGTITSVATSIA